MTYNDIIRNSKMMYDKLSDEQYTMKDAQLDMGACAYDTGYEYDEISARAERNVERWGLRHAVRRACRRAYRLYEDKLQGYSPG